MKTQNNNLEFKKDSVVELNDRQLSGVAGGGDSIGVSISYHEISNFWWPALTIIIKDDTK